MAVDEVEMFKPKPASSRIDPHMPFTSSDDVPFFVSAFILRNGYLIRAMNGFSIMFISRDYRRTVGGHDA